MSTPARMPFGVLNDTKLRNLQSVKNRQNAITPKSAPSLKRRAPSPEVSDSENIDPSHFDSSSKRKRAFLDDDVSIAKQARTISTKVVNQIDLYTPSSTLYQTPRSAIYTKPSITPHSAPVTAAGRSPTRPRISKCQPRRRFVPPTVSSVSPTLSLAAALKGTLAHGKQSSRTSSRRKSSLAPSSNESQSKTWDFAIFEEPEELQDYRMCEWTMTQSSAALEISDDESKAKSFSNPAVKDDKGKENVDPKQTSTDLSMAPALGTSSTMVDNMSSEEPKDAMNTEEPRTPLGDLNAAKFYGEGLDATSVVLVHDEVKHNDVVDQQQTELESPLQEQEVAPEAMKMKDPAMENFTFDAPRQPSPLSGAGNPAIENVPEWAQRTTIFEDTTEQHNSEADVSHVVSSGQSCDIDIWESESAKDENEQSQLDEESHGHYIVVGEGKRISLSSPCVNGL